LVYVNESHIHDTDVCTTETLATRGKSKIE